MSTETYTQRALHAYVETALWSSYDQSEPNGGHPLDANYGPEDLAAETLERMRADMADFIAGAQAEISTLDDGMSAEQLGHDFWLTRNRHGAGFWDRGLGELGERLTAMAHPYGESDLYIGDDGLIYATP